MKYCRKNPIKNSAFLSSLIKKEELDNWSVIRVKMKNIKILYGVEHLHMKYKKEKLNWSFIQEHIPKIRMILKRKQHVAIEHCLSVLYKVFNF